VRAVTGEWLLFTDADVMFSLGSLKRTVGYASEHTNPAPFETICMWI